jgi:hypothetical protein
MKHQTKLSQEQQQAAAHHSQAQSGNEFTTTEELLRFDAAQTVVPATIEHRLKATSSKVVSPPKTGWFKRLFN